MATVRSTFHETNGDTLDILTNLQSHFSLSTFSYRKLRASKTMVKIHTLSLSTWPHFHSEYDWVCQGSFPFEKKQKSIIVPPSSVRDRTNLFVCKVAGKEGYWLMSSSLQSKSFSFWNSVAIAIMFLWAVTLRWNFY